MDNEKVNGQQWHSNFNSNFQNGVGSGGRVVISPKYNNIIIARATNPLPFLHPQEITLDIPLSTSNDNNQNNFSGTPLVGRIADFDRTYTVILENPFLVPLTLVLFGAKQFMFGGGIPGGIVPIVPESSYPELMQESLLNPFIVGGMTVQSANPVQLNTIIRIIRRSTNGTIINRTFHIGKYFSIYQYQPDSLDIFPIEYEINGDTGLRFVLQPLTRMTLTFFVKKRIRMDEHLIDMPTVEISDSIASVFSTATFELTMPDSESE